ncbi:hypothetical protein ACLUWK_05490, partial [Bifidobacterium apri]
FWLTHETCGISPPCDHPATPRRDIPRTNQETRPTTSLSDQPVAPRRDIAVPSPGQSAMFPHVPYLTHLAYLAHYFPSDF